MSNEQHPLEEWKLQGDEQWTEKHWKILEAAVRVFSEKGFSAARTSEVAKEAGVSEGTVFNYFKTKKELLTSLVIPLVIKFFRPLMLLSVEKIFRSRKKRPLEEVLFDIMRDRLQLFDKNWPLVKTVAAEAAFHPELLKPIREQVIPKVVEVGLQFFAQESEKGELRDVDPVLAIRTLMSLIAGYAVMREIAPEEFQLQDEETEIRRILDLYLHGLVKQTSSDDAGRELHAGNGD